MPPVVDHDTHASTQRTAGHPYGCNGRPRPSPLINLGRHGLVPNPFSRECRHDKSLTDAKCNGCRHRGTGEKYAEEIRRNGR